MTPYMTNTLMFFILIYLKIGKSNSVSIDWSQTQQIESFRGPNRGRAYFGSCPCDITAQICDIYCCCDHECTDHDKTAFECLKGFEGGELTTRHKESYCNCHGPYSPEWQGFLCLEYDNNPYIGHFFSIFPIIKNIETYISKIKSPKYSYEEKDNEIQKAPSKSHYAIGSLIKVTNDDNTLFKGYLSLPQPSLYSSCIDSYPIKLLKGFSHICHLTLTPDSCINNEKINSNYYLQSSEKIPSIFNHNFNGNISESQFANVSVQYLCQNNVENYIKIQGLNILPLREKMYFHSSINDSSMVNCNGSSSPVYNKTHNLCKNVVLDIQYFIYWSGSSIDRMLANIIIGNIPVSFNNIRNKNRLKTKENGSMKKGFKQTKDGKLKITLLQNFSVAFIHDGTTNKTSENTSIETETNNTFEDSVYMSKDKPIINLLLRSGGPGYIIKKPLIAGYKQYRNVTQNTIVISESNNILEYNEELENISTKSENEMVTVFINNSSIDYELFNKSEENSTFQIEENEEMSLYNYSDINRTFSGDFTEANNEMKFHYIDVQNDFGLFIIKPVSDSECKTSNLEPIIFGIDSISGCKFYLHLQNDSSCSRVRDNLTEFLMSFVQADTLSKKGWPNATMEQDFIPILVENKHDNISLPNGCELPTSLEYTFVYQDVAELTAHSKLHLPIYQIMAASVRIIYSWYHLSKQSPSHEQLTISSTFIEKNKPSQMSRFWLSQHDPWCSGGICWRDIFHPWTQAASSHVEIDFLDSVAWSSAIYSQEVSSLRIHHFLENSTLLVQHFSNTIVLILLMIPLFLLSLKQHYHIKL